MRIEITDEAQEQMAQIALYLYSEWSPRVCDGFLDNIENAVKTIVGTDEIEILAFWDNRRDFWPA